MDIVIFAAFLLACGGAAASGALFPPGPWYPAIRKPVWTPPNWVFPVVWMSLYLLMSAAAARVQAVPGSGLAVGVWAAQLSVSTLWSPVFFGQGRFRAALVVLSCLWLLVAATTVLFFRYDLWAGLMFVPYLVWVSIAGALNAWIARNNADVGLARA